MSLFYVGQGTSYLSEDPPLRRAAFEFKVACMHSNCLCFLTMQDCTMVLQTWQLQGIFYYILLYVC